MTLRRWTSDPVILLALVAALSAFVIQAGELGTSDTTHRLQTAHSWWTGQPEVFPDEYPEFGIHGRDGQLHSWYGMGQSLLMFPADLVGSFFERLPLFANYEGTDPGVRSIIVSYSTNILINTVTALVCLRLLWQLGFNLRESMAGVLALLFCTTHLHYAQNMMENNYIMLLTLTGMSFQYEWLRSGSRRALLIGSGALGLNLLTRVTTALDLLGVGFFLLLVLWFEGKPKAGASSGILALVWKAFVEYFKIAVPVYLVFVLIDRAYQFHRFGSWLNTYVSVYAQEYQRMYPNLPAKYPWETPFHVGLLGPLFTPEKSIFLFDPLVVLTIVVTVLAWKRFRTEVKAYVAAVFVLLLVYISFYARYTVWSGDFAWGDRYVSSTAELVGFISVPLLIRYRAELGRVVWRLGLVLIAFSFVVQVASLMFWLPLEIYQMEVFGHPTCVIWLRFKNIVAFAMGRMEAWGLNTEPMTQDPWDFVHITTWNFLPFLLRRVGVAPRWVVDLTFAVWAAGWAALAWAAWRLRKSFRTMAP